ncbi:hypothetical protein M413DRAFT_442229 [Hebeloma cylindrosporum]|uniref:Organic hydroperoxide resistance protein n=1 Tax=Hebeloma cylindrosporum TaxID=76867 RepID=A0A0C2Y6U2_HEBCY|nr:hypothetical protein M413DRAFT_442229 [Hebeloma cylindrosporum h7]
MFTPATRTLFASSLRTSTVSRTPFNRVSARTVVTLKDVKVRAGRNGHVESNGLKLNLASPKELGGTGKGENPEQLFAMGYSACFLGAIQALAKKMGKEEMGKRAVVHTTVHLGEPNEMKGFALGVDIQVEGIDQEVLDAAHAFCPYSRALTHGAVVNVSLKA